MSCFQNMLLSYGNQNSKVLDSRQLGREGSRNIQPLLKHLPDHPLTENSFTSGILEPSINIFACLYSPIRGP